MRTRDDFPAETRRNLAARAGFVCSICGKATSGPANAPGAASSDGIAAHITAASIGGPRFDPSLSQEQRRGIDNGIWVCTQHGREIDADSLAFSVDLLRGLKRIREDAAERALHTSKSSTDLSAQLIEFPYAATTFKLFEIVAPQPYTFPTTAALRELIQRAGQPVQLLELAAEVIPSVWETHANVAGILSTMLSTSADLWQPAEALLLKLEQLCDRAVQSGDWSRIASVEPLAFALGAKGHTDIHRRVLERLIEESHWRETDASRIRDYYGTVGVQIAAVLRHWDDPRRKGLLRVNDVARLMNLLLSEDRSLVRGIAQQTVLVLLEKHALALKDCGEGALARRVIELVTALRHTGNPLPPAG